MRHPTVQRPTRSRRPTRRGARSRQGLLVALSALACAATLDAQATVVVGRVNGVKPIGQLTGCASSDKSSPADAAQILRGARPLPAMDATVYLDDALRIVKRADVRVRIDAPRYGRGAFYFTPALLCRQRGSLRIVSDSSGVGAYDISAEGGARAGVARPDLLVLTIETGAALIQWSAVDTLRPLKVYAPGGPVLVKGTELALIVDPAQRMSVLYVREGVVRLERYPALRLAAGQVFRLREGAPPTELSDEAIRAELEQQFAFHSSTVWESSRKPLWKQKKLYAISGAAAAAVGVALWQHGRSEPRPRRPGSILVHIPL